MIGPDRSDHLIASDVRDTITWDRRLVDDEIRVDVNQGRVRLTGSVHRLADLTAASADAWLVKGVREVDNELDVVGLAARDDRIIASDVIARLAPRGVDSNDLVVNVAGGVVTLTGNVDDQLKKREAVATAWTTPGVVDVVDRMSAGTSTGRSAPEIHSDVVGEIDRDSRISDASQIVVTVEDGVVRLDGSADSDAERLAAEEDAWFVAGVRVVENHLRVDVQRRSTRAG
jgi:osmotically-inducible protein OsmY